MDQLKIGAFIAECRKKNSMTQAQLAEKLGVTDRAVSKWENGRSMPDSSIMLDLCRELKITVNDLLSGEVVVVDNYNEQLEKNLMDAIKQKEKADKRLLDIEIAIGVSSVVLMLVIDMIASFAEMQDWLRIVLISVATAFMLVFCFFALRIEQMAGYYECAKCKHRYVPKYSSVLWAPHMGRTRYMKCPKCHEKSWQKKKISK